MMSTKVSTACNGFLIAKQLHGTRFSFVQLLVFDAYRYGLLTLSMGNARFFFFFLPLRVRFSRLIRVFFFPFSLFRCFFFLSLFFEGGEEGQDTSNRGMLFSWVCLISVLNSVVTYQLKVSTNMIKYDEIA